jgi:hypothetical protein
MDRNFGNRMPCEWSSTRVENFHPFDVQGVCLNSWTSHVWGAPDMGSLHICGEKSPHIWGDSPCMRKLTIHGGCPHIWRVSPPMVRLPTYGEKSPHTWGEVSPYMGRLPMASKSFNVNIRKSKLRRIEQCSRVCEITCPWKLLKAYGSLHGEQTSQSPNKLTKSKIIELADHAFLGHQYKSTISSRPVHIKMIRHAQSACIMC